MKKGVARELVFLEVNGGQLNDSASANRRIIDAYMPAAMNMAITDDYRINLRGEPTRDLSGLFYGFYNNLEVQVDATRHSWKYITLPAQIIALPRNQAIRGIEDGTGYAYKPLSDNGFKTIIHFSKIFTDKYFRVEGQKLYLFNAPAPVTNLSGTFILAYEALTDDDQLPVPAGQEAKMIQIAVEFVTGVRQIGADRKEDQRDTN